MILHFPAREAMGKENVIDLGEKGKGVLDIMCNPFKQHHSRGLKGLVSNSVKLEIFNTGIYTVVMSNKPSLISQALQLVPENKRPAISPQLIQWYEDNYPGYSVAVCCFDNQEAQGAQPLFWWYKPMNPQELFFPAVDCHSGQIPDLTKKVEVDHLLACAVKGIDSSANGARVFDKASLIEEPFQEYFPERIVGADYTFSPPLNNGDFIISKTDVLTGKMKFKRVPPPGTSGKS